MSNTLSRHPYGTTLLVTFAFSVLPLFAEFIGQENNIEEYSSMAYDEIRLFPHQIGVCDVIFTGPVVSTNDGYSFEVAVDEVLWGCPASTNITLRRVDASQPTGIKQSQKYLLLAYTNNWWGTEGLWGEEWSNSLKNYLTPTSRPADHAIFSDYRILDPCGSAISFENFVADGTNYWESTRVFITNMLYVTRILQHERACDVFNVDSSNGTFRSSLPHSLRMQLLLYKGLRYDSWQR